MLDDLDVMLVEDELLIAMDISDNLSELGARVVGPYATLGAALAAEAQPDVAVLDVDLQGERVFPLADRLAREGVPFMFHTGRADLAELRERYGRDVRVVPKPCMPEEIARTITDLV